jgi:alkylation response protein AidB-like acyl-CoA dehydrogenase
MNFGLTEEQEMIRSQAAEFFRNEYPVPVVRELLGSEHGYDQDLWQKMIDLGWVSLVFPEEYGGEGLTFVELAVLLEQMGRALVPGTFFSSVVLAGLTLLELGTEAQKAKWLRPIVEGKLKATLAAQSEPGAIWKTDLPPVTAGRIDDEYIINGTQLFVPDAHVANVIICAAESGSLFIVDRNSDGVNVTTLKTMDQTRRLYGVTFDRVRVTGDRLLGPAHGAQPAIEKVTTKATIGLCAEMIGGAQKMLDMSVEYAKQRVQFGRPIGSFQAIQHKCADMMLLIESARSATYAAAYAAANDAPDTALLASVAKAYTSDACRFVSGEGIQIHGGMGFTWEHDAHLFFKRAKADEFTFGDANYHRARVAELIGL